MTTILAYSDAIVRYPVRVNPGGIFLLEAVFTADGAKKLTDLAFRRLKRRSGMALMREERLHGLCITGYRCEAYRPERMEAHACEFAQLIRECCHISADIAVGHGIFSIGSRTHLRA